MRFSPLFLVSLFFFVFITASPSVSAHNVHVSVDVDLSGNGHINHGHPHHVVPAPSESVNESDASAEDAFSSSVVPAKKGIIGRLGDSISSLEAKVAAILSKHSIKLSAKETMGHFTEWCKHFNKPYSTAAPTEVHAKVITWTENFSLVVNHNNGNKKYKLRLYEWSDMTREEFLMKYTGSVVHNHQHGEHTAQPHNRKLLNWFTDLFSHHHPTPPNPTPNPPTPTPGPNPVNPPKPTPSSTVFDWRKQGNYVTPIRNQEGCGDCWAFSVAQAIESNYAIKNNKLVTLSPQQFLDCTSNVDIPAADDFFGQQVRNNGCNGGDQAIALEYAKTAPLINEKDYRYTQTEGTCQAASKPSTGIQVETIDFVTSKDAVAMKNAVMKGTVLVNLYASPKFQAYDGGIFEGDDCGDHAINHAVQAVGYGTENGVDYWILRNQWGDWGEDGYMRILRGSNTCQVEWHVWSVGTN